VSGVATSLGVLRRPLRTSATGLARAVDGERFEVSIREILSARRGEIPRLARFGSRLRALRMEPNDATLEAELRAEVAEAVTENDPRLNVLDARTSREGTRTWLDVTFLVQGEADARSARVPLE
jgi:phage baseplate assembly protein W